jgi:serine/threonine-protein kinase 24/25/MST4
VKCLKGRQKYSIKIKSNSRHKPTGKTVAIKVIDLEQSEEDIEDIQKEIHVLLQCHSPTVVSVYGSFVQDTKLWIIMEHLAGGSMLDVLKSYDGGGLEEKYSSIIIREVLMSLEYLHSMGLIHR